MNAREQARFDMIKRVGTFGSNNASDFTAAVPPNPAVTPGQTQAKNLFDALNTANTGLIALIAKTAETQQGGKSDFRTGTASKSMLREGLMQELKGINRTGAAIAEAQGTPEIMNKFRMPHGASQAVLVAKANAIADAAEPMSADFIAHGHDSTFVTDLRSHIVIYDLADDDQNTGEQKQVGATAGFNPLLSQAMIKAKQLDAFMHNFYRASAEKMGEWHTASHVEHAPKAKKKPATPAPTP
jgi:hypothetical protein